MARQRSDVLRNENMPKGTLAIIVPLEQKDLWSMAARRSGHNTLAGWARIVLTEAARQALKPDEELAQM